MAKCPGCGSDKFLGKGYMASGVCRQCYEARPEVSALGAVKPAARGEVLSRPATKVWARGDDMAEALKVCEACGQPIRPKPLSNAERQRRYRERKKQT